MHDAKREPDDSLRERMSDATSDETLSEIEEEQKTGTARTDTQNKVPDPDSERVNRDKDLASD